MLSFHSKCSGLTGFRREKKNHNRSIATKCSPFKDNSKSLVFFKRVDKVALPPRKI